MRLKDRIKDGSIDPNYYIKLAEIESSNNPLIEAETSSAAGLYQFTEGTWKGLVKQAGLDYTLEDRFDPEKSKKVVEIFTNQNRNYIANKIGKDPNQAELYITHFMGMGTAGNFLENAYSTPDLSVEQVIPENALKANRNVFYNKDGSPKKLRDVYNWAAKKFGENQLETTEDNVVYGLDQNGNYVTINPNTATQQQIQDSNLIKQQFYRENYNVSPSLTNYEVPNENRTFATQHKTKDTEQEDSSKKQQEDPWRQKLKNKVQERQNLVNLIQQGYTDIQTPEYKRPSNVAQRIAQNYMQDGGEIPTSPEGLRKYPKSKVYVPLTNGRVSMKNINYPVRGISMETGQEILMEPNKEYYFPETKTVLEIPQNNE